MIKKRENMTTVARKAEAMPTHCVGEGGGDDEYKGNLFRSMRSSRFPHRELDENQYEGGNDEWREGGNPVSLHAFGLQKQRVEKDTENGDEHYEDFNCLVKAASRKATSSATQYAPTFADFPRKLIKAAVLKTIESHSTALRGSERNVGKTWVMR